MGSKGIGRLLSFGIAKEAVRGTAETAPTFVIPFDSMDIQEKDQKVVEEQSMGVIEDSTGQDIVKQWAEGPVKFPIYDKTIGLILYALLGAKTTTTHAGESAVYDTVLTVGQNAQHPSLTSFIDDPLSGVDYKHALSVIKSLQLDYEFGKYAYVAVEIKAKKGVSATLTPSLVTENKFSSKHFTFKMASAQSGLDAASVVSIRKLSLKFEPNIEDDDALGSAEPVDFLNGRFAISGTIEAVWQDEATFKTAALAGTKKALRIHLKNTDVTIGNAANPELKIDLHKALFTDFARPITVNGMVVQTLNVKGHYDKTDAKSITATVVNTQASY